MKTIYASDLDRLIACPGSKDFHKSVETEVTREGTLAHEVYTSLLHEKAPPKEASEDMILYAEDAIEHLKSLGFRKDLGHQWFTEKELSFKFGNLQVVCKPDLIWFTENTLIIEDYKYGWSIKEPESLTMLAYGYAYLRNFNVPKDSGVSLQLAIRQPRPYHEDGKYRYIGYTRSQLEDKFREFETALEFIDEFEQIKSGEHCKNCSKINTCSVANKAFYRVMEQTFDEHTADINQLGEKYDHVEAAYKFISAVRDEIKDTIVSEMRIGTIVNGYKLTQNTRRSWREDSNLGLLKMLFGKPITEEKPLTPAGYEKTLNSNQKKEFKKIHDDFIEKKLGSTSLKRTEKLKSNIFTGEIKNG